jgi:rare lipoprotein A
VTARAASPRPPTPLVAAPPLLLALIALAGCAPTTAPRRARSPQEVRAAAAPLPPPPPPSSARPGAGSAGPAATGPVYQRGIATYYADKFTGRPTASGELYEPTGFTAAHRTLPLGALVDVARDDGRHVQVRINDRGPFGKGRVIDLSRRAALEIGLLDEGTALVRIRVLSMPPAKAKKPKRRRR